MTNVMGKPGRSALLVFIGFIAGCAATTIVMLILNPINQNQDHIHIAQPEEQQNLTALQQELVLPQVRQPSRSIIDRTQRATVYIEVEDGRGNGGAGSGWFGIEPGMVITNAHVIMMQATQSKPPAKITIYINSGIPNQQLVVPHARIRILAVDVDMDLAILQVLGEPKLPEPLQIRNSAILQPLDQLTVFGFPGGKHLSLKNRSSEPPTATINPTTMTRLVYDDHQNLYTVQLAGGIVHGNSGGPIINADGDVVAVSARVDVDTQGRFTNIAYAVPTEYVRGLLAGRAGSIEYGLAYYQENNIHIPVAVKCLDPMHRLKTVGITYWIGNAHGAIRMPGESHQIEPSDSELKEIVLVYDTKTSIAKGEIIVPKLPAGRVYMAQANYCNALVKKYWLASETIQLDRLPMQRIPADLKVRYEAGSRRTIAVSRRVEILDKNESDSSTDSRSTKFDLTFQEIVSRPSTRPDAYYDISLALEKVSLDCPIGMSKSTVHQQFATISKEYLGQRIQELQLSNLGTIQKRLATQPVKIDPDHAEAWEICQLMLDHTASYIYITLPNREMKPGNTWEAKITTALPIVEVNVDSRIQKPGAPLQKPVNRQLVKFILNVTYTYLGIRDRGGRKEAVVRIDGKYTHVDNTATVGTISGMVQIDLQSGAITEVTIRNEIDIYLTVPGREPQSTIIDNLSITCFGS